MSQRSLIETLLIQKPSHPQQFELVVSVLLKHLLGRYVSLQ